MLNFFATGQGVLLLGVIAGLIVLLWDWRVAIISLVLVQIGVAVLLTQIEAVSGQIMFVQTIIIALCATMIATAGLQVRLRRSGRQSGGWLFRLLVLSLLGIALYSLDLTLVLPGFAPAIARIFGWIALIALIMLSLGDHPVFTIAALLMWCVLGQAMAAIYAPLPEITIAIGVMELMLGLTASYLLLAEQLPRLRMITAPGNGSGNLVTGTSSTNAMGKPPANRQPLLRRMPRRGGPPPSASSSLASGASGTGGAKPTSSASVAGQTTVAAVGPPVSAATSDGASPPAPAQSPASVEQVSTTPPSAGGEGPLG